MSLAGLELAVIDFEATGLEDHDQIIEVAVIHVELGYKAFPRVAFYSRVKPSVPMSEGASKITGITDSHLAEAPTWDEVETGFWEAVGERNLVAYNAPFDHALLKRQSGDPDSVPDFADWVDPLVMVKVVGRYESHSLVSACQRRGITFPPHGAVGDAMGTALLLEPVMRETAKHLTEVPSPSQLWGSLEPYLKWQQEAAVKDEAQFCAYLLKKGAARRRARPDCPWHEASKLELPHWPEPEPVFGRCLRCGSQVLYDIGEGGALLLLEKTDDPAAGDQGLAPHTCGDEAL
ncbi:MAG: 3'-5' exonuclease [Proteobacteria bacterium]|nr:3'-5' exonuclease [Actinomycetes bacterium]MCP4919514.1 3'-5' exonuclease [Pseudomonadota bacterium]